MEQGQLDNPPSRNNSDISLCGNDSGRSLERTVIGIMSRATYENVVRFFLSIFLFCWEHKDLPFIVAFITRRCHVLVQIFWEIFQEPGFENRLRSGYFGLEYKCLSLKEINDIYRRNFITDNALLAYADHLAADYLQKKALPQILIVDELLIHGRALNHFLLELEEKLVAGIRHRGATDPEVIQGIKTELENCIHLRIYAKNNNVLLLMLRYAKGGRLICDREESAEKWKTLSLQFARVVSAAPVNNVSYAWSFVLPANIQEKFTQAVKRTDKSCYRTVKTNLRRYAQTTDLYFYSNAGRTKAICTIRRKKSLSHRESGQPWLYVPYIIYDQLTSDGVWRLHQRICDDLSRVSTDEVLKFFRGDNLFGLGGLAKEDLGSYYCWCVQTNDLLLNCLMMKAWWVEELALSQELQKNLIECIDWDQVARNYHTSCSDHTKTVRILKAIWNLELDCSLFREYLDILTQDSGAVLPPVQKNIGDHPLNEDQMSKLETAVQKTIYEIGLDAEKNAFDRYSSGIMFSEQMLANWGDHYSMQDIVSRCVKIYSSAQAISEEGMYYLVALIIQAMDLGSLGMDPLYGEQSRRADTAEQIYTQVRAGEQSLFIEPLRYRKYLPVLAEIEQRYQKKWDDQVLEIGRFVQSIKRVENDRDVDYNQLTEDLYQFVKGLYLSGQSVSMWNGVQLSEQVQRDSVDIWHEAMQDGVDRARYLNIYQNY